MNATVIKLNTLANAVRAATKDHDTRSFAVEVESRTRPVLRLSRVGGVVVFGVLDARHRDGFIAVHDSGGSAGVAQFGLGHTEQIGQIGVAEPRFLSVAKGVVRKVSKCAGKLHNCFLGGDHLRHLLQEPHVDSS